jgi:lipopolysaccharide export LptBFGC system permease protein LptF
MNLLPSRAHRKAVWRLIGGTLILAAVSNSLRQMPSAYGFLYVIAYVVGALVFAAIGLWLLDPLLQKKLKYWKW